MQDNSTSGGLLRLLLIYLALGAAVFAVTSAWVFAGLSLWGKS